jgi:hypothetical protein
MPGRPFQPGNKYGRGRPPGSKNKVANAAQQAAQAVLESHAESLLKKAVFLALQGNPALLRQFAQQLTPARQQRILKFRLPAIKTMTDLGMASERVLRGVTGGHLTPSEGQAFMGMLDDRRRMMESQELDLRVRALEASSKEGHHNDHHSKDHDTKNEERRERTASAERSTARKTTANRRTASSSSS